MIDFADLLLGMLIAVGMLLLAHRWWFGRWW